MPIYRLPRFTRPGFFLSIGADRLDQLLQPHAAFLEDRGLVLPQPATSEKLDVELLTHVLATPATDTPAGLADALYFIHALSTTRGLYALLDEIPLKQMGLEHPLGLEPADVAVRAWLLSPQTVERVHAELGASRPRRFDYFQTNADPLPEFLPPTSDQLKPLETDLDDAFVPKGRGKGTRVFAYPHERDCLFLVRRPDPLRREGAMVEAEATSVLFRPIRFDVVAYEPRLGILRVNARSEWETILYRQQFGKHLFGSMAFFPAGGGYTLDPLRSNDSACMACRDVPGMKEVALVEVELGWGGVYGETETRRASNLFAALRRRRAELATSPRFIRATFSIRFWNGRGPRTVTIVPPNVAQFHRDDDGPLIDQWLRARGFLRSGRGKAGFYGEAEAVLEGAGVSGRAGGGSGTMAARAG